MRCGLALLTRQGLGAEVQAAHGHAGFNVRVGIHTGGVLLGGGVDADGSIRGIAVNIAARMEQTAPPGGLRISHDTYAQVRGVFDVEPQPPLAVKGIDAPLRSYLVQRAKPRAFRVATRGIEGVETRMIGRDAELEGLQDAFERLSWPGRRPAARHRGGRRRRRQEPAALRVRDLGRRPARALLSLPGRATPQSRASPIGCCATSSPGAARSSTATACEAAKKRSKTAWCRCSPPTRARRGGGPCASAGPLIGLDYSDSPHIERHPRRRPADPQPRLQRRRADALRRISAQGGTPIVLQLEDLHWADDASLDFLDYLAEVNRDVPMLLLALTRPTLFERRADWPDRPRHQRIDLAPLDKAASRCSPTSC